MAHRLKLELYLTRPHLRHLSLSVWHSPYDFLALTRVFVSLVLLDSYVTHRHNRSPISRSPLSTPHSRSFAVSAVIVPHVTCDLPLHPVTLILAWDHLAHLQLADPGFGVPGKIDLLLGVEVFVEVMRNGRRIGVPGSPVALETEFGWVLAGATDSCSPTQQITTHHVSVLSGDDILR